ncbi:hypothetical protein EVAR_92515_1 [Eumeta japonica]|uniref:Uncharacterized protein n=1 Tax=Eumeta variegata TaxID=151549 RepID=A0A4C1T6F6_EUMVA|nr:hypothetical protein EVAR_92515_1 [Eumeta japonica]
MTFSRSYDSRAEWTFVSESSSSQNDFHARVIHLLRRRRSSFRRTRAASVGRRCDPRVRDVDDREFSFTETGLILDVTIVSTKHELFRHGFGDGLELQHEVRIRTPAS